MHTNILTKGLYGLLITLIWLLAVFNYHLLFSIIIIIVIVVLVQVSLK